ncbi:hypothetical protein [Streptomyces gobiensis]|uniref:hypothetical protein n=1 Tax=Streptomyces gobiensis TaxID=2875706 RepID=UPI001E30FEE4|nr:hypothetical protein [Streptomyces gobiensis]UGY92689.1 hypothetical protein test1122_13805 [Streptomyces gobiensis]
MAQGELPGDVRAAEAAAPVALAAGRHSGTDRRLTIGDRNETDLGRDPDPRMPVGGSTEKRFGQNPRDIVEWITALRRSPGRSRPPGFAPGRLLSHRVGC